MATLIAGSAAVTDAAVPLTDLGSGTYLGQFEGGLYAGGVNTTPAAHGAEGEARARAMGPLNSVGASDPSGRHVLLSIGMSNTTQEYAAFIDQAAVHGAVNHQALMLVDGARPGQAAGAWVDPSRSNYDRIRDQVLAPIDLTEAQVTAAWLKVANPQPTVSLPDANADAFRLVEQMGDTVRALKVRYPNLQQVFVSSRIYAGHATTTLNPEPYAYESGLAVKWLIDAQIGQMANGTFDGRAGDLDFGTVAPWIDWGPYLWADGLTPRGDGLTWSPADFAADGTHPSALGREKVGGMLLDFMLTSPFAAPWFSVPEPAGVWIPLAGWLLATRRRHVMQRRGTPFSTRRTSVCRG